MKNIVIPVDQNFNSVFKIGTKAFPFQMFYDDLENYSNGFVNWHKQKQIEISFVLKGGVRLHELGREHIVNEGDGFVVLPGFLHAVKPKPDRTAQYVTFIFDPVFLYGYDGSYFENAYYTPLRNRRTAACVLKKDNVYAATVLDALYRLYQTFTAKTAKEQLMVQRNIQDIWILLFEQFLKHASNLNIQAQDARIFQMITYLHEAYQNKFSLEDMARSHCISRGECCRYFKKMMGMTIMDYLLEYRISKGLELLTNTNMTVTEISQTVGIGSTSYFITAFKNKMSVTPAKYRSSFSPNFL